MLLMQRIMVGEVREGPAQKVWLLVRPRQGKEGGMGGVEGIGRMEGMEGMEGMGGIGGMEGIWAKVGGRRWRRMLRRGRMDGCILRGGEVGADRVDIKRGYEL